MSRRKDVVSIPKSTDLAVVSTAFLSGRISHRCSYLIARLITRLPLHAATGREGPSLAITYAAIANAIRILRRSSVNGERGVIPRCDKRILRVCVSRRFGSIMYVRFLSSPHEAPRERLISAFEKHVSRNDKQDVSHGVISDSTTKTSINLIKQRSEEIMSIKIRILIQEQPVFIDE